MTLTPIAERLREKVPELRNVRGAASLVGVLERGVPQPPEAFVFPIGETFGPNRAGTEATIQLETFRFGVVVAVRNLAEIAGAEAAGDLEPIKEAVKAAIVGWAHPDAWDACVALRGQLVSFNNQLLIWQSDFACERQLRLT